MTKTLLTIGVLIILLASSAFFFSRENTPLGASVGIGQALMSDTTGYARATKPIPITFPQDHGPHPDFKLEWWYYTGNLQTAEGRRFGYQFTIFRNALAPPDTANTANLASSSNWRTNQLYFAHFALSDIESKEFYAFERFSRGAAGLAGAQPAPFRAWLDDWEAAQTTEDMPPMRVHAVEEGIAIDLKMDLLKPIVLQGENGYSVKGEGYGNASYYYSMTRMETAGSVTIGKDTYPVTGLSWMDREWSTSLLGENQEGWDWFSLHLDDGRDLMYFNVRDTSDTALPYVDGVLIDQQGNKNALDAGDVQLDVLNTWKSPRGGVYPSQWRMQIPSAGLDLQITPFFSDQELDVSVRYWEGAVEVKGEAGGFPIEGRGYVELTGYDAGALNFTD